jgi:hypothetical protein
MFWMGSCSPGSSFKPFFNCHTSLDEKTERVEEFEKNFSVQIPQSWKTELYYDNQRTGIMTADTTRYYSQAYTLEFFLVKSGIDISGKLQSDLDSIMKGNGFHVLKNELTSFRGKPACLHWSQGKEKDISVHVLQHYVKINPDNYLISQCKIFGDNDVQSRLCEALSIIESLQFNQQK